MEYNGLDLLLSGILVMSIIVGWGQGLVRCLGGTISLILGLIIAAASYKELVFWIEKDWSLQSSLAGWLEKKISASAIPSFGSMGSSEVGLADPAQYLAYLLLLAICFLVLFFVVISIGQIITTALNEVIKGSWFSGVNRLLGIAAQMLTYTVILSLLIGITYPAIVTGAKLGLDTAAWANELVQGSILAKKLFIIYTALPEALELHV